jgi:hypothetical protein
LLVCSSSTSPAGRNTWKTGWCQSAVETSGKWERICARLSVQDFPRPRKILYRIFRLGHKTCYAVGGHSGVVSCREPGSLGASPRVDRVTLGMRVEGCFDLLVSCRFTSTRGTPPPGQQRRWDEPPASRFPFSRQTLSLRTLHTILPPSPPPPQPRRAPTPTFSPKQRLLPVQRRSSGRCGPKPNSRWRRCASYGFIHQNPLTPFTPKRHSKFRDASNRAILLRVN